MSSLCLPQSVIDMLPVAICVCSAPSGRIVQFNRGAAELWGREPELDCDATRYCGAFKLLTREGVHVPHDKTAMAGVLESGVVVRGLECMVERPDGSLRNVVTNIDPIRDQYGRIIGAVNVSQDVTARPAEQPVKEQPKSRPCPLGRSNASCTREGTILVVDDEEMVRTGIRLFLELYGLNVIDCADGAEALRIGSALKDEMVLLITDYMMPKMTGSELAQSMARIRPDLPIIFMSGYAAGEIGHERFAGATFLQKPFTRAKLVDMVCKGLESCPRSNRHPGTVAREANLVAVAH